MYDRHPYVSVSKDGEGCHIGWKAIGRPLRDFLGEEGRIVCVECYPGVFVGEVRDRLTELLKPSRVISTEDLFLTSEELARRVAPMLTVRSGLRGDAWDGD